MRVSSLPVNGVLVQLMPAEAKRRLEQALAESGGTRVEAARRLGFPLRSFRRYCLQLGVFTERKRVRPNRAHLIALLREHGSAHATANACGVTRQTVGRWIIKAGVAAAGLAADVVYARPPAWTCNARQVDAALGRNVLGAYLAAIEPHDQFTTTDTLDQPS